MLIGQGGLSGLTNRLQMLAPLQNLQRPVPFSPLPLGTSGLREPSYHPQLASLSPARLAPQAPPSPPSPYALPAGSTLKDAVSGTKAQPFDVTMSQLATSVYGTRGAPPEGWSAVSDSMLESRGIENPATWRQEFLGGVEQTTANQFKAEVYTDGEGNFVLAYRGTAEGAADWGDNFQQGLGFETGSVDKFTGLAADSAIEFARVFGDGEPGAATNLAITGHSQGGGLASVASLATGIPAVTFDASGIHPNTLDRLGLASPQQARDIAEGGQIRAYSMKTDLLTRVQESGPLSLAAPDALGTKIVVEPKGIDQHTLTGRAAKHEFDLPLLGQAGANALVEAMRNSGIPVISSAGQLAYNALSHSPNLLTDTMIAREPWQAGYQNPSDFGKSLHDMVPEGLRDDFARNTHEVADEVVGVFKTDMADGNYLQGSVKIGGHVVDGVLNSVGDTIHHTAEGVAARVEERVAGPAGDLLAGAISIGGKAAQFTADKLGDGIEQIAGVQGAMVQNTVDGIVWAGGKAIEGIQWTGEKAIQGSTWVAGKAVEGAKWTGEKVVEGGIWVAGKTVEGAKWAGNKVVEGATAIKDGVTNTGRAIGEAVSNSRVMPWNW
ncbi:Mbeg1-like protein [Novilysobacter antarcticus]|uniref:Mbeg1-like protein n=1 Tax=Novilysobacter antarcticus TaxID=2862543 RepID=UPI001C99A55D|nr:Mbeg1-like protein [Lysobacter antarcticus]